MENNTEVRALTFDEILDDKGYQSEFDRRVGKALETAREKWQKEAEANARETLKKAVDDATAPLNGKIRNLMISSEVTKASAKDAADVLPHLNMEAIKITDDGIEGLEEQVKELKEKKPYLFVEKEKPIGKGGLEHGTQLPIDEEKKIRATLGLDY